MTARYSVLFATCIVWFGSSSASAGPLPHLIQDLLADHPLIKAAESGVDASEAAEREALGGYLPRVDAAVNIGYETIDRTETNPAGNYTNYPTDSHSLTVTQPLFTGYRVSSSHESAKIGVDVAEMTLEQVQQQVMFEAINSYLDILRQIELNNLSLENIETLKRQLQLEDERVQRGSGIAVDVLQAKSRLQIAKERYTAFQGNLKDAISRFTQVFDREPDLGNLQIPDIPFKQIPPSIDEAIQAALQANRGLLASKYGVEVASLARDVAKSAYYPSVDLVSAGNYDDNVSGVSGTETRFSVTGRMSWNLYNGGADVARVKQAAANYEATGENYRQAMRQTVQEVKLAWTSLTVSQKRLDLLENAVNIAAEVYDSRTKLRDAGSETAINVLDAENELFRAKIDAASARYDYYTAVYRLLQAMGQLTPALFLR